ncbi:MAG: Ldh family oxidoreductase [Negativicutes bacterium]
MLCSPREGSALRYGNKIPFHFGHFFIAINPEAFSGLEVLKKTTGQIMRELRVSKRLNKDQPIYTAGEKEYLHWMELKEKDCR